MRLIIKLVPLLFMISFCTGNAADKQDTVNPPYDEWYFSFTTPKALPAQVTLVKLLDMNGYGSVLQTIDQPQGDSVGSWETHAGVGITNFNKAKAPPQMIKFCWDSIIDKKTYETTLFFHQDTQQKMLSSEPQWQNTQKNYYFQSMVIGLAPEGKVRVWLKNNGKPNVEQTSTQITTVSGGGDMCKDINSHPNGYVYYGDTPEFIKDKKYPYGNW